METTSERAMPAAENSRGEKLGVAPEARQPSLERTSDANSGRLDVGGPSPPFVELCERAREARLRAVAIRAVIAGRRA